MLTAMLLLPALIGAFVELPTRPASADEPPPNIVLILTDDQRFDTLEYMPIVRQTLGKHGVTFTNAYVSNPVCCPSRASILTGLYSHSTGVYTNSFAGGFAAFDDSSTIATWLRDAGYHTGLFGKYLNGYETTYVPPGWDRWFATQGSAAYYRYRATSDGAVIEFGDEPTDYATSVIGEEAISFIQETPTEQPLFAYVSVPAPHDPSIAAPGDERAFDKLEPWRPLSFNERDVKDKPLYIRNNPWLKADRRREIDVARIRQVRSLLAVDRLVEDIVDVLRETGRLQNTIVVFTSDNGVLWGEHRWDSKDVPYEESIRVPLIVRYDALIPAARTDTNRHEHRPRTHVRARGRRDDPCRRGRELPPPAPRPGHLLAPGVPVGTHGLARGERRPIVLRLPHEALRADPIQRGLERAVRSEGRSLATGERVRRVGLRPSASELGRPARCRVRSPAAGHVAHLIDGSRIDAPPGDPGSIRAWTRAVT
jgi:Sulfatase